MGAKLGVLNMQKFVLQRISDGLYFSGYKGKDYPPSYTKDLNKAAIYVSKIEALSDCGEHERITPVSVTIKPYKAKA